jgi:hypothetical protein
LIRKGLSAEAKAVLVYMGKTELGITQAAVSLIMGQGEKKVENKNLKLITQGRDVFIHI